MDAGTQSRGNGRTGRLMENETDRHKGRTKCVSSLEGMEKKRTVEFGYDKRRIL